MNKKEEKLLQIAEMYKYAAFTEQDREAFLDMALELKKLNKNNYCNTIIDLELIKEDQLTEDQMSMLMAIFE